MKRPSQKSTDTGHAQAMLRHWLKDVPNDRLAHLIKDATRGFQRGLQRRLSDHAVSFGHWSFLRILWDTDGLTQRELSDRAGVMEPTTFSALAAMEKLGYIRRVPSPEGGRKVFIHLTEAGLGLKELLVPMAEEINEIAVRGVRDADIAATRRTLLAIIANLAEDEIAAGEDDRRMPSTQAMAKRLTDS